MSENVYILFGAFPSDKSSYLEVINTETGERVKLWFGPGNMGIWNEYHDDHKFSSNELK